MNASQPLPSTIAEWHRRYRAGWTPTEALAAVAERLAAVDDPGIFIHVASPAELERHVAALPPMDLAGFPLWGIPFAVKDNIDVAGQPTTAACPAFSYQPPRDAGSVARLRAAGAIPIGKTNLDQFATGLVGVRTPHAVPRNVADPARVPGGSSSGSAVAVAQGLVPFALGTDTAGSGRVPAALNGIVGLKPSLGAVSTAGVVPACRTLDCVSVFARSIEDAWTVFAAMAGAADDDPFSRPIEAVALDEAKSVARLGVPRDADLLFHDDRAAETAWRGALAALARQGVAIEPVDLTPFFAVAELLYHGPWLAEREAALADIMSRAPETVWPVTRAIVGKASAMTAADAFRGQYRLAALKQATAPVWRRIDALAVPSVPCFPTLGELSADPVGPNTRLGTYTNFVNLLDLSALAIPACPRPDGLPAGVTLIGARGDDARLAAFGLRLQKDMAGGKPASEAA
jgi:allophanate hydrolase